MGKIYIFMGKSDRHDLERLGNYLDLTLVEAAVASFPYKGRNRHAFNRLFLVVDEKGGNNFIHNHTPGFNEHLPMKKNMIYFMPCNADLQFSFNSDMTFISFHFHLELPGNFDIFQDQTSCSSLAGKCAVIKELYSILASPDCNFVNLCRMRGLLLTTAAVFIKQKPSYTNKMDFINNKYSAVFDYIRNKADASTGIDKLASIAKMSRDSLSREFSQDCGITLKDYLTRNLLRKAESLLLIPNASARKVAQLLKFNNEYYFSRFFKKNTGTTTKDYRKQMLSGFKSS